ncbi:MAG: hypothetical protein KDK54_12350 [Leptospiraceae bacterium]|nr:hypothetical protein [Leptospiraceae bacterium]
MIIFPVVLYILFSSLSNLIKSILYKPPHDELKLPPGMKIMSDIKKSGNKYKGTVTIDYTVKINKKFPVEAENDQDLIKKYNEIIAKYKF